MKIKSKILLLILSGLVTVAHAFTVDLDHVIIEHAPHDELNETVLPAGALVYRLEEPEDVRVGDGVTPGGHRICNTKALTEPPDNYDKPLNMQSHPIYLSPVYSMQASGPGCYLRANGNNIMSVIAAAEGVGNVLDMEYIDYDDGAGGVLLITISVPEGNPEVLVEYSPTLIDPVWSSCTYGFHNLDANTIQIQVHIPPDTTLGFCRITSLKEHRVKFSIPVEVPELSFDEGQLRESGTELQYVTNAGTTNVLNKRQSRLVLNHYIDSAFSNSGYIPGMTHQSAGTLASYGFYNVQNFGGIINPAVTFREGAKYELILLNRSSAGFGDGVHIAVTMITSTGEQKIQGLTDVYNGTSNNTRFTSADLTALDENITFKVYYAAYDGGNGATILDTTLILKEQ